MSLQPVSPQLKDAFQRVVMAGLKIMYSPQTRDILQKGLTRQAPLPVILAQEVAGLLRMMDDRAGMKIPKQILIPAGIALMQDLSKFMEEVGLAKPTEQDIVEAMQSLVAMLASEYKALAQQGGGGRQPAPPVSPPAAQPAQQPSGLIGAV